MVLRILGAIALIAVCTATSCVTSTGVEILPDSLVSIDSASQAAFELAARVSARRGLASSASPDPRDTTWTRCFTRHDLREATGHRSDVHLCGKVRGREILFLLRQVMSSDFTPQVDSLRVELLDSLRVRFGEQEVRECEWDNEYDPRRSGCRPAKGAS